MKFYVWGVGEPQFEVILKGRATLDASRAAYMGAQAASRPVWDPREHSSWAVEIDIGSEQDLINISELDPAIRGWMERG